AAPGSRHRRRRGRLSLPKTALMLMCRVPRRQLAAPDEEVAHPVIEVSFDSPVRDIVRARAEIAAPSPQQAVQRGADFLPRPLVARNQDRTHLVLQTLH